LPKNQSRARRVDDRRVISGIIHLLRARGLWRRSLRPSGARVAVQPRKSTL
jgi:hypothetical protein